MSQFRVGIIGCGWVGRNRHLPSYERDDRASIVAVCDRNPGKAERVAEENDIPAAHDSMNAFLSEDLDVVSICTPPWTHANFATRALREGVNVLTEKPMAMSPAEGQSMVRTAAEHGTSLGVVHNFLFASSMRKARMKVQEGEVGEIQSVIGVQTSSQRRNLPRWYPELPGQLFYDESPHLLYLIEEFLGELEVDSSSIYEDKERTQSVQTVHAALGNESGRTGTLSMTFDAPLSEWHLAIVGRKKVLVVDIFRDILLELGEERSHDTRDVIGTSLRVMGQELFGMAASGVKMATGSLLFGMGDLTRCYLDRLEQGREPPVTGEDGLRTVRIMHNILEHGGVDSSFQAPSGSRD